MKALGEINGQLTQEIKKEYILMLKKKCESMPIDFDLIVKPLSKLTTGTGFAQAHPDAVDYYIKEGSPIHSINAGVVVSIVDDWSTKNGKVNVSEKGGNFVIIFNPKTNEFSRYCHMESVAADLRVGQIIEAGKEIGRVGHTGSNANKPGHGGHLHLEINKFENGTMTHTPSTKIVSKLEKANSLKEEGVFA